MKPESLLPDHRGDPQAADVGCSARARSLRADLRALLCIASPLTWQRARLTMQTLAFGVSVC